MQLRTPAISLERKPLPYRRKVCLCFSLTSICFISRCQGVSELSSLSCSICIFVRCCTDGRVSFFQVPWSMSLEFPQGTRFECFALGDLRFPLDLGESTPLHTSGNLGLNTWLTSCEANLRRFCSLAQSRAFGPVFVLPFSGSMFGHVPRRRMNCPSPGPLG